MISQLHSPLWLTTPKGLALCHFIIDYGIEHDLLWVCFQQETGECWTWENSDVRICENRSIKREFDEFAEVNREMTDD